ncbi:MAG: nucleoside phosphorylase [Candidatus Thorarchaeota archaeon]
MDDNREYHIGIAPGEMPRLVLLPGDPDRAKKIADTFFDGAQEVARRREYWSFRGTYKGVPVGVCSTGIGCPSAAIALEELTRVGCTTFVRVGTAGAIDNTLRAGNLAIFTGSVREDGTSIQYVPVEFPALADPVLTTELKKAAEKRDVRYRVGIGHSKDAFYSEHPDLVADPERTRRKWAILKKAGVIATEMESAALFVIGYLRDVRVGTVCMIIGEPVEKEAKIESKPPIDDLILVALDALVSIAQKK